MFYKLKNIYFILNWWNIRTGVDYSQTLEALSLEINSKDLVEDCLHSPIYPKISNEETNIDWEDSNISLQKWILTLRDE